MSDFNYQLTLEDIGLGLVDLEGDTIKVVLCTSAYTPVEATDHYLSDIPGGARVATATLTGKSFADGVFSADAAVFALVPSGSVVTQAVIYQDASPESGARLIRKISSDTYGGLPYTTNNADITLAWPVGGSPATARIFEFVNA